MIVQCSCGGRMRPDVFEGEERLICSACGNKKYGGDPCQKKEDTSTNSSQTQNTKS